MWGDIELKIGCLERTNKRIFKNNQAKFILQNLGLRYLPLIKALYGSIFQNLKHSVALKF
jgi:hypothetical protein